MTDEQKAAMKKGREAYVEKQRQERESKAAQPVVKVEGDGNIPEPTLATANGHANLLDISEPSKWQMKIRMHLESLDAIRAEQWMDGYRLMGTVAGRMVRDQVYSRVTAYCFVCDKPLRDGGKPAGTAQYFDGDRQRALSLYQDFKFKVIAQLPMDDDFVLTDEQIENAITGIEIARMSSVKR